MNALEALQSRIGYEFQERTLLKRALTHRSHANEHREQTLSDNQRLEFLGDAVLGMVISNALFLKHPGYQEGPLSKLKAQLVCEAALARIAISLNLGSHLLLGRGEERSGGRTKKSLLADAYEALIAAIYLDGGYTAARSFVLQHHQKDLDTIISPRALLDAKSKLQELIQDRQGVTPTYRIPGFEGPDHARIFHAEVLLGEEVIGSGSGNSKKDAHQEAAADALSRLGVL